MTQFLPPNLLALFAPRDPIPFLPPIEKHKYHRKIPYTGCAQFLSEFEDAADTPQLVKIETREERKERKRREKQEQANYKLERDLALWNPKKNPDATSDAFSSLFVCRLNYDTTDTKLKREFEVYGQIKKISIVKDKFTGKNRGYAFIEFESERDMQAANKDANGRKIDGYRILVDIERGRTRPDWRPRRLGKGLGRTRDGPADKDRRREDTVQDRPTHRDRGERDRDRDRSFRDRDRDRDRMRTGPARFAVEKRRTSPVRSREHNDRKKRSRSRDRDHKKRSRSRDRDRRRGRYRDDMISQYGEYGAEIRAEYNGDM